MFVEFGYAIITARYTRITVQVRHISLTALNVFSSMSYYFRQSKSIAVTSMAFPNNEINNFILGSEDGCVYSGEKEKY